MEFFRQREQLYYKLIWLAGLLLGGLSYFYPGTMLAKLAAATIVGALVMYHTRAGLYLFALAFPFLPNLSVLLLAGLIGVSFLMRRVLEGKLTLEQVEIEPPLILFMVLITLGTFFSVTFSGSMRDYVIYVAAFTLFYVVVNHVDNREQLYRFITWLLLGALLVSLYGIYQYIIGVPAESGWIDPSQNPDLTTRVFSVFGNPNILAEYLLMMIPFGLAMGLGVKNIWRKLFFLGITGVMALTLLLTFSRGSWVAVALAVILFALLKDRRMLVVFFGLGVLALAMMPEVMLQRLATIGNLQDTSNNYRILLWQEAVNMIRNFWATGIGFGHLAFRELYPYYMMSRTKTPFHLHNTYLQVLVETGIIGFTILFLLLASTVKSGVRSMVNCQDPFVKSVIIASLAAFAGVAVQGITENIFYMPKIIILFWLVVSLLLVCGRLVRQEGDGADGQPLGSSLKKVTG